MGGCEMADYRPGIGDELTIKAVPGELIDEFAERAVIECRKYGGAASVTFNDTTIHIGTNWDAAAVKRQIERRLLDRAFPTDPAAVAAQTDKIWNEGMYEWPRNVFARPEPANPPLNVLAEAARITSGDRHSDYGHPEQNLGGIADAWSAYLRRRYGADAPVLDGRAVAMLNIMAKVIRDAHKPKRDNLIDIAGYARTAEMLDDEQ